MYYASLAMGDGRPCMLLPLVKPFWSCLVLSFVPLGTVFVKQKLTTFLARGIKISVLIG